MNQPVSAGSPLLETFELELAEALDEVARFVGTGPITFEIEEPVFTRLESTVTCRFEFTTELHSSVYPGHVLFDGKPHADGHELDVIVARAALQWLKQAMSEPALKADITDGRLQDHSRVVRDEVAAVSSFSCDVCSNGTTVCHGCNGRRQVDCAGCRYSAQLPGRETCWHCHGMKGMHDAGTGQWSNCSVCRGWGYINCRTCGGSTVLRCGTCGGHGTTTCTSCRGHGFFTETRSVRIGVVTDVHASVPEGAGVNAVALEDWVREGMPGRATSASETLLPYSDVASALAVNLERNGDTHDAELRFQCSFAATNFRTRRQGQEIEGHYTRLDRPLFTFPPFLDQDFARLIERMRGAAPSDPAGMLRALKEATDLAEALRRDALDGDTGNAVRNLQASLRGTVSSRLLTQAADIYAGALGEFRTHATRRSTMITLAIFAALWPAGRVSGAFDFMLGRSSPAPIEMALVILFLAALAFNTLVARLTSRRIQHETGAQTPLRSTPWWVKALAGVVGVGFTLLAMGSAT